jgi:hypothetical protein
MALRQESGQGLIAASSVKGNIYAPIAFLKWKDHSTKIEALPRDKF